MYGSQQDLDATGIFNIVREAFVFSVSIEGEERLILYPGGYKGVGGFKKDPERAENAFGRQVDEQIHDEIVEIEGTPYILFCEDVDPLVVDKMRMAFDIQEVEYDLKPRVAILGHTYDAANAEVAEGKVISQAPPIFNNGFYNHN